MKHIVTILLITLFCASCANGNKQNETPAEEEQAKTLCGGYTDQRDLSEEDIAFFKEVTAGEELVLTPVSVATQVVAGVNYKFLCRYEDKAAGESGNCTVTIFRDLKGNAKVTKIEKEQ